MSHQQTIFFKEFFIALTSLSFNNKFTPNMNVHPPPIISYTVDPRLTDGSTYRHFELQTSLAAKFRFDLQPENRPTDQKKHTMEQKWNKKGRLRINQFSMHCRSMEPRPTDFSTCSHCSNTD